VHDAIGQAAEPEAHDVDERAPQRPLSAQELQDAQVDRTGRALHEARDAGLHAAGQAEALAEVAPGPRRDQAELGPGFGPSLGVQVALHHLVERAVPPDDGEAIDAVVEGAVHHGLRLTRSRRLHDIVRNTPPLKLADDLRDFPQGRSRAGLWVHQNANFHGLLAPLRARGRPWRAVRELTLRALGALGLDTPRPRD